MTTQNQSEAWNMKLISHDQLLGYGGIGEGMAIQESNDGRRIMWLAHEAPPKNFTAVDITDVRNPKVICQTELPHKNVRSNSLDLCGDLMAVAYQTMGPSGVAEPGLGLKPAGIELFDISKPESPQSISFFDCSGPASMGVHQLWFVDGNHVHFSGGSDDFIPTHPLDCQFYRCIDVRNPTQPVEVCRWWFPGTRKGDDSPPPPRHPKFDSGFRAHNTNVYPERPDRVYLGYLDGGTIILDIADMTRPKLLSHWNPHPPFPGFTHTVLPLFDRDLILVTDECVRDNGEDWPKLTWVVDARDETNLVPISTFPMPPVDEFAIRGGRFGAHNLHENRPGPAFRSSEIIFGAYFNAGVRVHDIRDPFRPEEIAYYIPEAPHGSRAPSAQINDVYVDENQLIYAVDRFAGGLYVLELTI